MLLQRVRSPSFKLLFLSCILTKLVQNFYILASIFLIISPHTQVFGRHLQRHEMQIMKEILWFWEHTLFSEFQLPWTIFRRSRFLLSKLETHLCLWIVARLPHRAWAGLTKYLCVCVFITYHHTHTVLHWEGDWSTSHVSYTLHSVEVWGRNLSYLHFSSDLFPRSLCAAFHSMSQAAHSWLAF